MFRKMEGKGRYETATHAMTIRAALAYALDFPLHATLSIDIAPLSRIMLSFNRKWRLQSLIPG